MTLMIAKATYIYYNYLLRCAVVIFVRMKGQHSSSSRGISLTRLLCKRGRSRAAKLKKAARIRPEEVVLVVY